MLNHGVVRLLASTLEDLHKGGFFTRGLGRLFNSSTVRDDQKLIGSDLNLMRKRAGRRGGGCKRRHARYKTGWNRGVSWQNIGISEIRDLLEKKKLTQLMG